MLTVKPLDDQAAFEIAAFHLLRQRIPSTRKIVDASGSPRRVSAYIGDDGKRDPIGALLLHIKAPFDSGLEGWPINRCYDFIPELHSIELSLLIALQDIHDNHPTDSWRYSLIECAVKRQLDADFLESL